jgi:hypothetical protein
MRFGLRLSESHARGVERPADREDACTPIPGGGFFFGQEREQHMTITPTTRRLRRRSQHTATPAPKHLGSRFKAALLSETIVISAPSEVIGTTCDSAGAICGPYEQERSIARGYTCDRVTTLHCDPRA